jgi:glycosyltransferase involved in cell wall biosynthesis
MNGSNAPIGPEPQEEPHVQVSVVIPVFNEEGSVVRVLEELRASMDALGMTYEVLVVDDGSVDATFEKLIGIKEAFKCLRVIRLRRNYGQTAALSAGFDRARGEYIVTMDGDGQNDPADIPALIQKLEEGFDLVSGWRQLRQDAFVSRKLPSFLANWLVAQVTGIHIRDLGCALKIYRAEVLRDISMYGDLHRFMPALVHQVGGRIAEIPVRHHPRTTGTSKYGLSRTKRVILDLMTVRFLMSYGTRPMHFFGTWGLRCLSLSALAGVFTVVTRVLDWRTLTRNPFLYLTLVCFLLGIQFISLGLLGEINIRTYHESQGKPIYFIKDIV